MASSAPRRLETIAQHYVLVADLVAHYRQNLRMRYLPVRYEDMVATQETTVRKILDFIGVDFDPDCLSFEHNTRYARTASYAQVTEKLYNRSRYRYRPYLPHFNPVLEALGPVIARLGYTHRRRRTKQYQKPRSRTMFRQPFTIAVALSLAGAVPFLVLGAVVLLDPLEAATAIEVLISYGAVILSFTGAVHWGFALRDTAHPVNGIPLTPAVLGAERQLLIFGVVPAIIGWVALSAMLHFARPGHWRSFCCSSGFSSPSWWKPSAAAAASSPPIT